MLTDLEVQIGINCEVGTEVEIGKGARIGYVAQGMQTPGKDESKVLGRVKLGEDAEVSMNSTVDAGRGEIRIGDYTIIRGSSINANIGHSVDIANDGWVASSTISEGFIAGERLHMTDTHNGMNVELGERVILKRSTIGNNCTIRSHCYLESSTLGENVALGAGVHLTSVLAGADVTFKDSVSISAPMGATEPHFIFDAGCEVAEGVQLKANYNEFYHFEGNVPAGTYPPGHYQNGQRIPDAQLDARNAVALEKKSKSKDSYVPAAPQTREEKQEARRARREERRAKKRGEGKN